MNSKKKNKNRQNKPPNPNPPQKKEVTETVNQPEEINESVVEERVPAIVSENVNVVSEVKPEETPKKPKRNKGKKKDGDKSDKEEDILTEQPAQVQEIQPAQDEVVDASITPTARKKKNKNKKNKEAPKEEIVEEKEIKSEVKLEETITNEPQEEQTKEENEAETKSSKKKNKKKKNHNDSEQSAKSEKEEMSCTSAFQQLLVEDKSLNEKTVTTTDESSISEATVKEAEITTPQSSPDVKTAEVPPSHKDEGSKNKKKNKKDKKHPPSDPSIKEECTPLEITQLQDTKIPCDITKESTEAKTENIESSITQETPSTSTVDEQSPKQKAKIAKPVEKKKKGKENMGKSEIKVEPTEEVKITEPPLGPIPPEPVIAEASSSTSADVELLPFITLDDNMPSDTNPDWQEEVKLEEGNGPVVGCEEKLELSPILQNGSNKRRKKSPKPQRRVGTVTSPDIAEQTVSAVDITETKIEDAGNSFPLPAEIISDTSTTEKSENLTLSPVPGEQMDIKPTSHNENKQKGKKSPKPQRKHESSEISSETSQPGVSRTSDESIPTEISSTENAELKTVAVEKVEAKNEETRTKTPDSEKRQKGKKSPKLQMYSEQASSSKGKGEKGNKNMINIDDIIIIQAEVVSDEKAKQGDTYIASDESIQKEENKSDRHKSTKGKKSPKPPKKENTNFTTENEPQAEVQMPITPNPTGIKLSSDLISVEQVSKVDAEPSPSDITPDIIEYPRCSSEQLMDTNNNMVIQEISQIDSKLTVPLDIPDTPFIESTDLPTPELFSSGIKETETAKKPVNEKTDLKSKVMEVNKDMEELRLSIEKSLAELTSLDKMDKDIKKKLDEGETSFEKVEVPEKAKPDLPKQENIAEPVKSEKLSQAIIETPIQTALEEQSNQEPVCPERKDRKGKGKSKKKGKQDAACSTSQEAPSTATDTKGAAQSQETKKDDSKNSDQKSDTKQDKGKQQSGGKNENKDEESNLKSENISVGFEPIENFEDAMTSSSDDVNKSFEIIANEANPRLNPDNNPEINIIAPQEDEKDGAQDKKNTVTPPKNLLGHPDIPVPSSKTDYKKEKNKTPNYRQAKVKIKDCNQVEFETDKTKQSKESQTENKRKFSNYKNINESICVTNKNEDYVYKYSFRKVFLQCTCHVCKKDLSQTRVPCSLCNLIFYCSQKHKDEDYAQHQGLCFAVSTIIHLKNQKFIYADAQNVTGYNYRLLRMQMIVSCEKILKRKLAPWEQEALLYPRICADAGCREWRQGMLRDCEGCGQISYCTESHLPKSHSRWCKSYSLYRALVRHQQTRGRLEPKLPTRVVDLGPLPDNINEVLASMYEERIDMSDIEYAALTQLATAPLTALYCLQAYHKTNATNGLSKKSSLTLHIVGAELQFEADVLNKWEVFLLHLVPVKEIRVVLVGPELNPSNLPLDLLGKIKLCGNCQQNKRRVVFGFQDKRNYHEFWASDDFTTPDLVCAFNPSIQRSSAYNGKDSWPFIICCVLKQKVPFVITSHTLSELTSDLLRIQEFTEIPYNVVFSPKTNSFASVRPDRNFISDDEAPLLFKNHCVTVLCGV